MHIHSPSVIHAIIDHYIGLKSPGTHDLHESRYSLVSHDAEICELKRQVIYPLDSLHARNMMK